MIERVIRVLTRARTRKYIYRVATAVLLLIAAKGYIDNNEVLLWQGVLAAVTEMAAANVNDDEPATTAPPEH